LRLGSFLRPDNAASLRAALRRHGFAAEIVTASVAGKSWREVQIGGFQDRASVAAAEARVLRELGIAGGLVLKTGWQ